MGRCQSDLYTSSFTLPRAKTSVTLSGKRAAQLSAFEHFLGPMVSICLQVAHWIKDIALTSILWINLGHSTYNGIVLDKAPASIFGQKSGHRSHLRLAPCLFHGSKAGQSSVLQSVWG